MAGGEDARALVLNQPRIHRNQETGAAADRKGCCGGPRTRTTRAMLKRLDWLHAIQSARHQVLKPLAAMSTGRLCTQASDPGSESRPSKVPASTVYSVSALHLWETHRKPKCTAGPRRFQGDPESVLQRLHAHCRPNTTSSDTASQRSRSTPHCNRARTG